MTPQINIPHDVLKVSFMIMYANKFSVKDNLITKKKKKKKKGKWTTELIVLY